MVWTEKSAVGSDERSKLRDEQHSEQCERQQGELRKVHCGIARGDVSEKTRAVRECAPSSKQ